MAKPEGRTSKPGNSTVYHSIDIATSNPGLLQPGSARNPMRSNIAGKSSVPSWTKGKSNNQASGLMKKSY